MLTPSDLHEYQKRSVQFMLENEQAGMFLDMGLGKTVITLTAIARLLDSLQIRAALVVAPLRVIELVWEQEAANWSHTRHLRFTRIRGALAPKMRILKGQERVTPADPTALHEIERDDIDIFLINYEHVITLGQWMKTRTDLPFDMVVWDESSKMKSKSSKRFKMVKHQVLKIPRRVLLTGTPAPQSYLDLWSQIYLLDAGKRLETAFGRFQDYYFRQVPHNQYAYKLREGYDVVIQNLIRDLVMRLDAKDYLEMPELVHNTVKVSLPPKALKKYKEFEEELFAEFDDGEIEAFNAAAKTGKCRQLSSGCVYDAEQNVVKVHDAKLDALQDIIDEMQGEPLIVCYEYRHEIPRLMKRWPKARWIGSGSKNDTETAKLWNAQKLPLLFVQPASVGHGLNLQSGGHNIAWLTTTWSLELYYQMVARLYRQGQKSRTVYVHHIVAKRTIDSAVMTAIQNKSKSQNALLRALKAYRRTVE